MQVHRYRGRVAIAIGTGATVYLTPREARKLGKALADTARDVGKRPKWSEQPHSSTVAIVASDPTYSNTEA